jgi:ribonuclease P protein component
VHRFPSASRLTRKADLELVRHEGKRFRTDSLEVRHLASLLSRPRVGIIVPLHKQTHVARNRVKRRLRELSRQALLPALAGRSVDVVMRAMPAAYAASHAQLGDEVSRVIARLASPSANVPANVPAKATGAA